MKAEYPYFIQKRLNLKISKNRSKSNVNFLLPLNQDGPRLTSPLQKTMKSGVFGGTGRRPFKNSGFLEQIKKIYCRGGPITRSFGHRAVKQPRKFWRNLRIYGIRERNRKIQMLMNEFIKI